MNNRRFYQGYSPDHSLDKDLRALYEEGGKLPDMKHINHKRHRRTTRILTGLVLFFAVLSAASWAGFLLFNPQSSGSGEVEIRFDAPENIKGGTPQEVIIRYRNLDRQPLAFAALRLRLPQSLAVLEVQPKPADAQRLEWEFGTLPSRGSGEIKLKVMPYGLPDERLDLIAILNYKPANFNAEFQSSKTHTFVIKESALSLALSGPTVASIGQTVEFKARLRNLTEEAISQINVILESPSALDITSDSLDGQNAIWKIDTLQADEAREITFAATVLSGGEDKIPLVLRAELEDDKVNAALGRAEHLLSVAQSDIALEIIVNETPDTRFVRIGDALQVRVRAQNRSDRQIDEVGIMLSAQSELIDWTSTKAEDGKIDKSGALLRFPESGTFTLAPGASSDFTARIATDKSGRAIASPLIKLSAEVSFGDQTIQTQPLPIAIVSDLGLSANAFYFNASGGKLGQGPLPPRPGEATQFRVKINLQNSFHDLSNLALTAPLPKNAVWVGNTEVTGGRLEWNEGTREARWEIPRMTVGTREHAAQFDIAVTPASEDQGGLLTLIGITRVEALDTISQITFSRSIPPITSALDADPFGKGKGVVE